MRGYSFFGGARRAQELVAKNPCRAGALECLSDLLMFLSKTAVAALTFVAGFSLLAVRIRTAFSHAHSSPPPSLHLPSPASCAFA